MITFIEWLRLQETAATEDISVVLKPMAKELGAFLYNHKIAFPPIDPIGDEDPDFAQRGMLVKSHGEETPHGELWSVKVHPQLARRLDMSVVSDLKKEVLPKWRGMFRDAGWQVQGPAGGDKLGWEVIEPIGHEFLGPGL
jgi:hypothetical protein